MNTPINSAGKKVLIICHPHNGIGLKQALLTNLPPGIHENVGVEVIVMDKIPTEKDDLRRLATKLASMNRAEVRQALEIQELHSKYIEPDYSASTMNDYKQQSQQGWRNKPKHKR